MATFDYNPITGQLDLVGAGGGTSYIDGEVEYHSNLPVTAGTPAVNSAFLVRKGEGLYFVSRKPAGIWVRELNNGNLDDWKFAGTFSDLYRDANFRILNNTDITKELAFDVSGVTTGTTRTLTVPNASGTLGWLPSVSSITVSTDHQLTAARNQRVLVNNTNTGSGPSIYLPSTGTAEGDRLEVVHAATTSGNVVNVRTGPYDYTVSDSISFGQQRTFIYSAGAWSLGAVESHTHAGLGPTFASSVFQVTEPSGVATNRLAFSLSGITTGATRTLTVPNANGTIALTGQLTDTQIFTANGTWTKPAGAKLVHFLLIAGGGGGGAGRRGAAGTLRTGGGGGSGGGIHVGWIPASALDNSVTVTVGSGGAGGVNSADDTSGQAGADGGATSFGSVIAAYRGNGGAGGIDSGATVSGGAATVNSSLWYTAQLALSGGGPATNGSGGAVGATMATPTGGGGGAGISAANAAAGNGGAVNGIGQTNTGVFAGPAQITSAAGGNGGNGSTWNSYVGTGGGGARMANTTFIPFKGGNGGLYGAGGGGGSGGLNASGGTTAGGDGANGIAVITTYF